MKSAGQQLLIWGLFIVSTVAQETPNWIWGEPDKATGEIEFVGEFELDAKPDSGVLHVTADDFFVLVVNGQFLLFSENWRNLRKIDVTHLLKPGPNKISIRARNREGAAGLLAWLEADDFRFTTSDAWQTRSGWNDENAEWAAAFEVGELGVEPWGDPWSESGVEHILAPEGFVVEKVYDVPPSQGSWVAICNDSEGGFYASDQDDRGVFRFRIEGGQAVDVRRVAGELSGAQGLMILGNDLYAHVGGTGLVRTRNGDVDELGGSRGRGEHGIHGVIREPGTQQLLTMGGNASGIPEVASSRVAATYENHLIERFHDPLHAKRAAWVAPAGWVCRYDPDKAAYETFCVGFRNAYDLAANAHGDLFTFDSDEEWDLGMPWYRPTRICMVVSGGDYGWRAGSDNWPPYYEDSLPPLVEIGPGSPTGMLSGAGAKFPARYQNAIFALDWTYGTMRALHLRPAGSSYDVKVEEFVTGAPLPMTDAVIAADGSMVLTTGGRRIASAVYRVRYVGEESTEPAGAFDYKDTAKDRSLRRELEAFHGKQNPAALDAAWPHLASPDRFLRHAARVAVEWQPVESWTRRLETETRPQAIVTGVVALARMGKPEHAELAQQKIGELDLAALDEGQMLGALRGQALVWERLGVHEPDTTVEQLLTLFPHESGLVTCELARLLAYQQEPRMIEPALRVLAEAKRPAPPAWADTTLTERNTGDSYGGTFDRFLANRPPETAIRVASFLVELSDQWSEAQARRYFEFLQSLSQYQGGASYGRFQIEFRNRALANAGPELAAIAADFPPIPSDRRPITVKPPLGPGREWTVVEALTAVEELGWEDANRESGRNLFHATSCVACHVFDGEGGAIGPDLSNVRGKFGAEQLLEAIIEPSKAISDQFGSYDVELTSGKVVTGLVIEGSDGDDVRVYVGEEIRPFPRTEGREIRQSPVSAMPPGLVNSLSPEELRDLVAYLLDQNANK